MKSLAEISSGAEKELTGVSKELVAIDSRRENLQSREKELAEIVMAIKGLEITEQNIKESKAGSRHKPYDPGKYDTAYFYVQEMSDKDIKHNSEFKPSFKVKCKECNSEAPVLMSYTQTEDSVDGDTWEKIAFTICCGKIEVVAKQYSDFRFL